MKSTLTLLREEGYQEGFRIGYLEGLKQGKQEGFLKVVKKGKYTSHVIAVRNMTLKKLQPIIIAEYLSLTTKYVQQLQKELKKEASIITALAKKQSPAHIAKSLKVSEWLVEVIQEVQKK